MTLFDESTMDPAQREQATRIAEEHARRPHAKMIPGRMRLHVLLHVVAETQIAERKPPAAAEALERLTSAGVERHLAVHAICDIVAEEVVRVVGKRRDYDEDRYIARLERLGSGDCERTTG